MKRLVAGLAAAVAMVGFTTPAHAVGVDATTTEGPYGPLTFQDYGSCANIWANISPRTTYFVKSQNGDGTYDVRVRLAGKFVSIAGQSPGACDSGTDNGNLVPDGIKGHLAINLYIVVSDGTFNPDATCDDTCATDYSFAGVQTFVTTFFGDGATYAFSSTRLAHEVVHSRNRALCLDEWTLHFDPSTGIVSNATGDIATTCHGG